MNQVTYSDVCAAYERIRPYIYRTPLEQSVYLSNDQHRVFLKLECAQPIKAFKIRGVFNRLLQLTEDERKRGIAAVSSGNHGIALSYAASKLGLPPATIIVPKPTPTTKIDQIRYYGGNVLLMGDTFDESHALGMEYINSHDVTYIDGWDNDPHIYAGQGTAALELLQQNPEIDTILTPIGGGGLVTSSAIAAKGVRPDIKVIGLYSESCPAWADSIRDNRLYYEYESKESVCEAMVGGIGRLSYSMREVVDDALCVKEEWVKKAMVHAILKEKIVAEAAGAVPIAAMLQYGNQIAGKNIALIISGGNVNSRLLLDVMKNAVL